ncbi:MAG: hypothetical protein PUH88_09705 [Lachnospiraceae bacterium]|nr:hypothetical protein [Lachnospiraceae bacterium]
MKRVRKTKAGKITIEVSIIVPVISIILVGVVFLLLFFLDMSVVKSETVRISNEVASCWKADADLSTGDYAEEKLLKREVYFLVKNKRKALINRAEKRLEQRLKERLVVTGIKNKSVKLQIDRVVTSATIHFLWPLNNITDYMGTEELVFTCRSISPVENREEKLRIFKSKQSRNEVKE